MYLVWNSSLGSTGERHVDEARIPLPVRHTRSLESCPLNIENTATKSRLHVFVPQRLNALTAHIKTVTQTLNNGMAPVGTGGKWYSMRLFEPVV